MNVFDFVAAINQTKADLFEDPQANKDYVPFVVNRAFSYFPDTVFYANEINQHPTIPKEWQFNFLLHSIPKKKRFSKWVTKTKIQSADTIAAICEAYKYSTMRAIQALEMLTEEQVETIRKQMDRGGKHDTKRRQDLL